jgi:hypothetical protein
MRKTKAKQIRKYLIDHAEEVMILIRNEFGSKTEEMGPRQIYQHTKKLYKSGKLKV